MSYNKPICELFRIIDRLKKKKSTGNKIKQDMVIWSCGSTDEYILKAKQV